MTPPTTLTPRATPAQRRTTARRASSRTTAAAAAAAIQVRNVSVHANILSLWEDCEALFPSPLGPLAEVVTFYRVGTGKFHSRSSCRSVTSRRIRARLAPVQVRLIDVHEDKRCLDCGHRGLSQEARSWERHLASAPSAREVLTRLEGLTARLAGVSPRVLPPRPRATKRPGVTPQPLPSVRDLTSAALELDTLLLRLTSAVQSLAGSEDYRDLRLHLSELAIVVRAARRALRPLLADVDDVFALQLRADAAAARMQQRSARSGMFFPERPIPATAILTDRRYQCRPGEERTFLESDLFQRAFTHLISTGCRDTLEEALRGVLRETSAPTALNQIPPRTALPVEPYLRGGVLDLPRYVQAAWKAAARDARASVLATVCSHVDALLRSVEVPEGERIVACSPHIYGRSGGIAVPEIFARFPKVAGTSSYSLHIFPGIVAAWLTQIDSPAARDLGPLRPGESEELLVTAAALLDEERYVQLDHVAAALDSARDVFA